MSSREERKEGRGSKDFTVLLIIMAVLCIIALGRQEYRIYQIRKEAAETRQRVEELQKMKADLEAERQRLYDPKYIEKLAREDHNMVGKDEVPLFIVKDRKNMVPEPKQETTQGNAAAEKKTEAVEKKNP